MRRFAFHILLAAAGLSTLPVEGKPLSDCTHAARLEVAGYAGTETLTGVPVLVRLSEAIPGFHYADCGVDGAGLVFCDEANEVVFPHEIDEWNPDGESLVWVRLPEMASGTAFQMGWGGTAVAPDPHAVWSDYAGVWHMNEASGTAFDSTTNGLNAVPTAGTNSLSDVSQMVAYEQGAVGRARVNATQALIGGNHLTVTNYDSLLLGDTFVASGWFHADIEEQSWPKLFWRDWDNGGWGVEFQNKNMSRLNIVAGDKTYIYGVTLPHSAAAGWTWVCVAYHGTQVSFYCDGILLTNATIVAVRDNGGELMFGSLGGGASHGFVGQYDEIRLRGGTLSADRIHADYDIVANRDFLTYVPNPTSDDLVLLAEGDLEPGVTIRLGGAPDGWTLHYTTNGSTPTADSTVYGEPFTLAESATVKVVAVNDDFGWTTGVAEQRFDLAPLLAVTDARAQQRYPWNGLVDVDFTLAGDTAKCYRVSLDVTDLDGGTNLAARTVWEYGGTLTNEVLDVAPGSHRFVWNAGADLPEGFVADRLAVSLRSEYLHDTALYMVVDLSGGPDAAHYPVSYLPDVPEGGWTDDYKMEKLVLRRVEPGRFTMGGTVDVTLTKPFFAGLFEVTQKQYNLVTGTNPSSFPGDKRPVEEVSYDAIRGSLNGAQWPSSNVIDSSSFLGKLQGGAEHDFDLPTEAQWEYSCRAGTTTASSYGNFTCGNYMWYTNNSSLQTHNVGEKLPNTWGLYDMHGNVWERCLDWYDSSLRGGIDPKGAFSGTNRVRRGGAWNCNEHGCTSSFRSGITPSYASHYNGFRLFLHDAPAVVEAPIVAPAGLMTTTNRVSDITLAWEPVAGAYAYQIRRSKTGAFEDGTWLNTVTNTTYADWTAEARTDFTYWVRAQFESGKVGRWSEGTRGWRHAKYLSINLSGGASASSYPIQWFDQEPAGGWSDEWKTTKLVLRGIDPGTFMMGSPEGEVGRDVEAWDETQHFVTLTKTFYIGVFPTTQKQYTLVNGTNPSRYTGNLRPVENISWNDLRGASASWPGVLRPTATSWLGKVSKKTGMPFDLPTEAQWEYACRAGTTTSLYTGRNLESAHSRDSNLDPIAYYQALSSDPATTRHTVVGTKLPNSWGLYDMLGNVWNFCLDWYGPYNRDPVTDPVGATTGTGRVVRGGSYYSPPHHCRAATRTGDITPSATGAHLGFRLCLTME